MALTLASAARLLSEHGLLREIIQGDAWTLDAQTVNGFDKPSVQSPTTPGRSYLARSYAAKAVSNAELSRWHR